MKKSRMFWSVTGALGVVAIGAGVAVAQPTVPVSKTIISQQGGLQPDLASVQQAAQANQGSVAPILSAQSAVSAKTAVSAVSAKSAVSPVSAKSAVSPVSATSAVSPVSAQTAVSPLSPVSAPSAASAT